MTSIIKVFYEWLMEIAKLAINLLPDSPIQKIQAIMPLGLTEILAWINYVIPLNEYGAMTLLWLTAVVSYMLVRHLLKIARYV